MKPKQIKTMEVLNFNLSSLKKPELLTTALEFQHAIKDNAALCSLLRRLENLETELLLVKEDFRVEKKKNRRLNNYIEYIEFYADELEEFIDSVDAKLDKLNQYSRRENLEILDIPPTVFNNALKSIAIAVFKCMGINIHPADIHACHKLPKTKS